MSKMVLDGENKQNSRAKAPAKRRGRVPTTKSKAAKDEIEKASSSVSLTSTVVGECSTLLKQKGNVLRLKAHNFSMQQKCEKAEALLKEAAKLPIGHQEAVVHGLTEARHLFQEALILMSSDPIFGVLQDSSITIHTCH
jgi:separase